MSLIKLRELVAPPPQPLEVGDLAEWPTVEQRLGLPLPSDYRDFILTYGTGKFANFYCVYNPFSISEWVNLHSSIERLCKIERELKRDWPNTVPYQIFPDRPGLLPWGCDDNGNYYYWVTEGVPDSWHVVSNEVRGEGYREYGRCMSGFFCDVLTGKIQALAGDYPQKEDRVFEPFDVRMPRSRRMQ